MNSNAVSPALGVPSVATVFEPAARVGKSAATATAPITIASIDRRFLSCLLSIALLLPRACAPTITEARAAGEPRDRRHRPGRDCAERPFRPRVLGKLRR